MSVLLAAVGVGILIGRATVEEPAVPPQPFGLASANVQAILAGRMAALNKGDAHALAAFYAPDAILEERDQYPAVITKGSKKIASHLRVLQSGLPAQLRARCRHLRAVRRRSGDMVRGRQWHPRVPARLPGSEDRAPVGHRRLGALEAC